MKIYFLSSIPCELTLNGIFFGIVDSFERFTDVNLSDRIFAKFTPQGALPVGVFLDEQLLDAPPEGVEVYIIKEGIALYIKEFPPSDFTLQPIVQERLEGSLITIFRQGKIHLSLETAKGFFIATLPPSFAVCKLSFHSNLFFIEGQNQLAIYTNEGKCVFLEQILSFEVSGNTLNATLPLSDSLRRVADCAWELDENGCRQTKFILRQNQAMDGEDEQKKIAESLLPYAFFESVLIKADYTPFLCEELQKNAEHIAAFLGEFRAVTLTKAPNTVGLVREKAPRVFALDYFTVLIENGKIIDIKG